MERFALAAAVVLGFALTAALCSLFVPLRRVLERREQQQQPVQSEQPRPAPLRAPLWGGLCAAAGTVAAVGVGCCGSLLAAGAIGCIPLSLDMTSLTVPLALPFWAAGGLLAAQLLCAKRTGKPLRCWVKKHKMSPETVFLCSFALSAVGYVLALALLRWC